MPIPLTCQCGKKMNVKDEAAGKRIRCPACQQLISVPLPKVEEPIEAIEVDEEPELTEADDSPRPKKKKKKPAKSSKTLYIILGGAALLLFCCCPIGGGGVWFFFFKSGSPEKTIIGKWKGDADAIKKVLSKDGKIDPLADFATKFMEAIEMEIKADDTMTIGFADLKQKGKWKVVKTAGKTVTIELKEESPGNSTLTFDIEVIDSDHLKMVGKDGSKSKGKNDELYLKRVK